MCYNAWHEVEALSKAAARYLDGAAAVRRAAEGLGWEPSMEYVDGPDQTRWKLRRKERLYGLR